MAEGGDKINRATEEHFERFFESQISLGIGPGGQRFEYHEKVEVASPGIKIASNGGSKYFETAHAETLAELRERG